MVYFSKTSTTSTPCYFNNSDGHVSHFHGITWYFLCLTFILCQTLVHLLGLAYSILHIQDFMKCIPRFSPNIIHIYIIAMIISVCNFCISIFPKVFINRDSVFSTTCSGTKHATLWVLNTLLLSEWTNIFEMTFMIINVAAFLLNAVKETSLVIIWLKMLIHLIWKVI